MQIYSTGPGTVNNALQTGAEAVAIPPAATIGDVPAPVSFAGPALGFIGLHQVNVHVPQGMIDFPVTFARRMAISPHNARLGRSRRRSAYRRWTYCPAVAVAGTLLDDGLQRR